MSGSRASVFGNDEDFDVSGFAPKPVEKPAARPEQVRVVSEAASFRSREPKRAPDPAAAVEAPRREQRRYRTGRNVQLNIKVRPEALQDFYALIDQYDWVQGDAFERAIAALKRELGTQK
jgi:hypothetical protein